MRFYIVSGEASGDLHGANLIKALKKEYANLTIRAWGGDLMQNEGAEIIKHYRNLAFMGFVEVVKNLKTIFNNLTFCKEDILKFKPDAIILIDYPGFNLRIAKFAKENGIKVIYYISPQIWAWKQSRVHQIKRDVGLMLCVLPFEEDFYKKFNYLVSFVGHPLLDAIEAYKTNQTQTEDQFFKENQLSFKPIIALLPGSRQQEIQVILSNMLTMVKYFPNYQFVVAGAPGINPEFYNQFINQDVKLLVGQTYRLLQYAQAALVTSGTATLETALFEVPQIVCYKGSTLSYYIAKRLIKVKYISLVNLIMDKQIVTELIQHDLNEQNLRNNLENILINNSSKANIIASYKELKQKLGGIGASERAAKKIVSYLNKNE